MDAVKFLEEYRRMCESYENCDSCPLLHEYCDSFENLAFVKKAVLAVEDWLATYSDSVTTRADLFKKMYPDVPTQQDGALLICPRCIDKDMKCSEGLYCWQCRKNYWLKEVCK